MKTLAAVFVIAGTAVAIAPAAYAGKYSDAIDNCKIAIAEEVGDSSVKALLGNVRQKSGARVQLDFKVKVGTGDAMQKKSARCLATSKGEVLELTVS